MRKDGANKGRLFWSCPARPLVTPRGHSTGDAKAGGRGVRQTGAGPCGLFEWADAEFPRCLHGCCPAVSRQHSSITVDGAGLLTRSASAGATTMRRVLKPGANNGRSGADPVSTAQLLAHNYIGTIQ